MKTKVVFETHDALEDLEARCVAGVRELTGNNERYVGTGHSYIRYRLTFSEPVELFLGKRKSYVTSQEFEVKELFFKNGYIYYVPLGYKSRGFRLSVYKLERITLLYKKADYVKKWAAIARSCRRHNINPDFAQAIEDHLAGKEEYIRGCGNRYTRFSKPRCASFSDVTRGRTIAEMWDMAQDWPAYGKAGETRKYFMERIDGKRRDRSVHLSQFPDGSFYLSAASEYHGCGNGDYYVMYSPTMAVFLERD